MPPHFFERYLPDLTALTLAMAVQAAGAVLLLRGRSAYASRGVRGAILVGLVLSWAFLIVGTLLRFERVSRHFEIVGVAWARGMVMTWAFLSAFLVAALAICRVWLRVRRDHSPSRRAFLRTAQIALFGVPTVAAGYGVFIERYDLKLREVDLKFPDLPKDLHGIRLVQLTDVHMSPFLSEKELARAVDLANETRADIALMTGDLITYQRDPLDTCLAQLSRLRATAGVYGCLGNHEIYTATEDYVEREGARLGIRFLRSRNAQLKFGDALLNLAGVDYQPRSQPYLVGAETLIVPGTFNVMLSHNPDVFPVAAKKGFRATISGHTHGGQVRFEILKQDLNVARFYTPYVDGEYRKDDSAIFVSRGIGTIGLPARLGAPPEVALLRLCRA